VRQLKVYYEGDLVGTLLQQVGQYIPKFYYDSTWIEHGFPLSLSLPLIPEDLGEKAFNFFTNLLPEGDARTRIVGKLKIPNDDFSLLGAIGGECAGALVLCTDYMDPADGWYEQISESTFDQMVETNGLSITSIHSKNRLSLAGAQDKLPIYMDGDQYYLPQNGAASTHIIKFNVLAYKNVPAYETLMAMIASEAGITVAPISYHTHTNGAFALIERYDRELVSNYDVRRLHQEDFCQATGRSSGQKYPVKDDQTDNALGEIIAILREYSSNPLQDMMKVIRWQIFNVLSGNSDAHLKNISLLYAVDANKRVTVNLAPFYDLVCTHAIERISKELAIPVGKQDNPDNVHYSDWVAMADDCGVTQKIVINEVMRLANYLPQWTVESIENFEEKYGAYPALQRIERSINILCRRAIDAIELQTKR
jgi:serine/threonine-protein kinase HipA